MNIQELEDAAGESLDYQLPKNWNADDLRIALAMFPGVAQPGMSDSEIDLLMLRLIGSARRIKMHTDGY